MSDVRPGRLPHALALALAVAYVAVLWSTAPSVGFTRDEGYYFKAAAQYAGWWEVLLSSRFLEAFSDAEIQKHFGYNTEHPPLVKLSFGFSHALFTRLLGWADDAQGYRAGGFLWSGFAVYATFLLGRRLIGPWEGLFAAAALVTLPRFFFHAHLACFDAAMTAMWTISLWAFHRAWRSPPERRLRTSAIAGVVFGLALATKLNALFLPFIFLLFWLYAPPGRLLPRLVDDERGGKDVSLPPVPVPLLTCALFGPVVFVAVWPHLWHDTFARIGAYLQFHLRHEHYPISYFGELLVEPPFPVHFPFVMTAVTVPAPLLLLGTVGLTVALVGAVRRRLDDALLVAATLLPIALIALPSSPIFGGVKHWFNAMPTLLIAGGRVVTAAATAEMPGNLRRLQAAAVAVCLLCGAAGIAASHPNGIGYYNALVGGYPGGAELGMQRGFWGGLAWPAFDALPERGRVFFNRTNYDSYRMYDELGMIPEAVGYANDARGAKAAVVFEQPEHGEAEAEVWTHLGIRPVAGTYQDGVTLTQIYLEGPSAGPPLERPPSGHPADIAAPP